MLDDYLKGIFKTAKQADATEPSYYPTLKGLLEAFAQESGHPKVQVTAQPKKTEAGNPDFRLRNGGLPGTVAKGLAVFLNSTLVDSYFRQFSGHTQVNATDLRSLRYPAWDQLVALGRRIGRRFPDQDELDRLVEEVVLRG